MITIATVVEGHGEVLALPLLLRRLVHSFAPEQQVVVPPPFRLPRGKFAAPGDLERAVKVVSRRVDSGGVLVLADADDDCPVDLARAIDARLSGTVPCPVRTVLANREYEAWFLASMRSLRVHRDVKPDAEPHPDPETVRNAKGVVAERLLAAKYSETRHQPAFTELLDLQEASACRSFRKLSVEVARLVEGPGGVRSSA